MALKDCDIVVFLLTRNFYRSEFCLYEMGAVWINDKEFIPILIDNLTYEDIGYLGFELDIGIFRDLLSLSSEAKSVIESVKVKFESAVLKDSQNNDKKLRPVVTKEQKQPNEIEEIVLNPKFKEIEALLFQYMIDTTTLNLGDRWMASNQKDSIKHWEDEKSLNDKLSTNYVSALSGMIYRKLVDVASSTSYGNPREYRLKDGYFEQMTNLSSEAPAILDTVRNAYEEPIFAF